MYIFSFIDNRLFLLIFIRLRDVDNVSNLKGRATSISTDYYWWLNAVAETKTVSCVVEKSPWLISGLYKYESMEEEGSYIKILTPKENGLLAFCTRYSDSYTTCVGELHFPIFIEIRRSSGVIAVEVTVHLEMKNGKWTLEATHLPSP